MPNLEYFSISEFHYFGREKIFFEENFEEEILVEYFFVVLLGVERKIKFPMSHKIL